MGKNYTTKYIVNKLLIAIFFYLEKLMFNKLYGKINMSHYKLQHVPNLNSVEKLIPCLLVQSYFHGNNLLTN